MTECTANCTTCQVDAKQFLLQRQTITLIPYVGNNSLLVQFLHIERVTVNTTDSLNLHIAFAKFGELRTLYLPLHVCSLVRSSIKIEHIARIKQGK